MEHPRPIRWLDDRVCEIDGVRFKTVGEGLGRDDEGFVRIFLLGAHQSTPEQFVLLKTAGLIDLHARLIAEVRPARIFQLGIFQGGSVALVRELARPEKLVAIEFEPSRVEALDHYVESRGLSGVVSAHFGVDQGDVAALERILAEQFGSDDLDLVIDDASHRLAPTRTSFDLLFPRLRPGGVYVIEDWASGSFSAENEALEAHLISQGAPLVNLVFELTLVCASRPELVAAVEIVDEAVVVRRGPAAIDPVGFSVRSCFDERWLRILGEADYRLS